MQNLNRLAMNKKLGKNETSKNDERSQANFNQNFFRYFFDTFSYPISVVKLEVLNDLFCFKWGFDERSWNTWEAAA